MKKPAISDKDNFSETYKQVTKPILARREGSSVKGKVVCLDSENEFGVGNFPKNKEDVAFHLAVALEDEDNLAWYQKLARERRKDLLRNCLGITLKASKEHKIQKTKAAYFTGVVKTKKIQQERLKEYKRKHQKHTTYYGSNSPDSNTSGNSSSEELTELDLDKISKGIDEDDTQSSPLSSLEHKTLGQMDADEQLELVRSVFGNEVNWVEERQR
jgi:hypothetical protein